MPVTMELLPALAEIRRRNNLLATGNEAEVGDDLPPVEARIAHYDLNVPQLLWTAEAIARMGRAANVTLVVAIPAGESPRLELMGSAVLREAATDGRSVRVEEIR